MWTLAHPLRLRILELLANGPATASRLARQLGESRGVASYHLRQLARAGIIVEDAERGTKRERWWRRPDDLVFVSTEADAEGRAISARFMSVFFAREDEARRRFLPRDVGAPWHEAAFVGNWYVDLSPSEALEVGERLLAFVHELRTRTDRPADASTALVSISILPWLE